MTRIILVSGKGGVGKTTVASSTGLASARKGHRTLVLSFDLAHSLSDSFDLNEELFASHAGLPVKVIDNLDIQEIDVQEEIERRWSTVFNYTARIMTGGGVDAVLAEELAIPPGTEDLLALLYLNQYVQQRSYDVIIVDCPPTSDSLRFVGFATTLDWYVSKRMRIDRKIARVAQPMARMFSEAAADYVPDDDYFQTLQELFDKLRGIDAILRDPKITTVRLVTNPDRMVVRETQRAYMYFCLYGMTTDAVVVNRLLPAEGFFAEWAKDQAEYAEKIDGYFEPVPVFRLPLMQREVVGIERLETFAAALYADRDPAALFMDSPGFEVVKEGESNYRVRIPLPFAPLDKIDVSRKREELTVRIGTFKRNIMLPRTVANLETGGARMELDSLVIRFHK